MSTSKRTTVAKDIFLNSLVFLIIILALFSGFYANTLYRSEMGKAKSIIQQRNSAINFFIEGYFSEIKNYVNILAEDDSIQNAPILNVTEQQKILDTYRLYLINNDQITYVYSGYSNGLLLIDDYTPPEVYNPADRPWYTSAMAARPEVSVGTPYQDINDKEWLIATSKAFVGKKSKIYGVVCIDSSIQMIADLLSKRNLDYKSSYSFILNQKQKIIIDHNETYLNRILSDIIETPVALDESMGEFSYKLNGVAKQAIYSRVSETGWTVVTVVEKSEIINPIISKIALTIVLPFIIALLFSIWQSRILSRRFSKPLYKLQKEITAVISGNATGDPNYSYPNNEIGFIAKNVEQLTEKELYKRAQKLKKANAELNQTLEELKTLRGIIPICSSCKSIRDDKGAWNQLESYIGKHSDAQFSHGICPDCANKLYGDLYDEAMGWKTEHDGS